MGANPYTVANCHGYKRVAILLLCGDHTMRPDKHVAAKCHRGKVFYRNVMISIQTMVGVNIGAVNTGKWGF